jgi:hypothetical protein
MEYREAIEILLKLKDKYSLDEKEKQAVLIAVGTLDGFALGKNRIKGIIKKKKEKNLTE